MFLKRKEGEMNVVRLILIVVFLAIIIPTTVDRVLIGIKDNTQQCKVSLSTASFVQENSPFTLYIQCRPDFIKVGKTFTTRNGKYETFNGKRRYKEEDAMEIAKEIIAREMARCWEIASRGRARPYKSLSKWKEGLKYHEGKNICIICSKIHFSGINGEITDFMSYIKTHKVPGKDLTYREFLNPARIAQTIGNPEVGGTSIGEEEYDPHLILIGLENSEKLNLLREIFNWLSGFFNEDKSIKNWRTKLKGFQISDKTKIPLNKDYYVMNLANVIRLDDKFHMYFNVLVPVEDVYKVCDEIVN